MRSDYLNQNFLFDSRQRKTYTRPHLTAPVSQAWLESRPHQAGKGEETAPSPALVWISALRPVPLEKSGDQDLRGTIGSTRWAGQSLPKCNVVRPPKTSGARSRASSCKNGPHPLSSFLKFESLPPLIPYS